MAFMNLRNQFYTLILSIVLSLCQNYTVTSVIIWKPPSPSADYVIICERSHLTMTAYSRSDLAEQAIKELSKLKTKAIEQIQYAVKALDLVEEGEGKEELETLKLIENEIHSMHGDIIGIPNMDLQ